MTEEDLAAIDQLMKNRDHFLLHSEDFSRLNGLGLMDKVPDLVAEVRRLNLQVEKLKAQSVDDLQMAREIGDARDTVVLQNEDLRGRLSLICNAVEQYVSAVGPEQIGSNAVKVWRDAMATAREGWGAEQQKCERVHQWTKVGHAIASAEGTSGPIERCAICGAYKGRES